jgi:anti-anti-sigma factor
MRTRSWRQDREPDTPSNRVEVSRGKGAVRIALVGELDYGARHKLDDAYLAVIEQPPGPVVADLSRTEFLGSVGLGFLVQVHQWASKRGYGLTIESPPRRVRRALSLTRLDQVLRIEEPTRSPAR